MTALALALALAATPADFPLDNIAGVRLGDSEAVATAELSKNGPVSKAPGEGGAIMLQMDTVTATVCRGKVVQITDEFAHDLHTFAVVAQTLIEAHGPADPADIMGMDWERPGPDPRRPAKLSMTAIRVSWAKAPAYLLVYQDWGTPKVSQNLNGTNPCEPVKR